MKRIITIIIIGIMLFCMSSCGKKEAIPALITDPCVVNGHEYSDATCTEPAVCTRCGEEDGEALGHDFSNPTCTEAAVCSRCGEEGEKAIGHDFSMPTCTEPEVCSRCGEKGKPAIGHSVDEWEITAEATCTELGSRHGVCTVCGEDVVEDIACIPHTEGEWEITTEATFDSNGTRKCFCTECEKELKCETYTLNDDEKIQWLKDNCESADSYENIRRDPDGHQGKYVRATVECFQVFYEDASEQDLLVNITPIGWGYYDDIVAICYERDLCDLRVIEDDVLTVYGQYWGEYSYETVQGDERTVPLFLVYYCTLN